MENLKKCQICGKEFKHLSSHLVVHKITTKEYYDFYLRKANEGYCIVCGNEVMFEGLDKGYIRPYCSCKCSNSDPVHLQHTKEKNLELFGVEWPQQNKEIKNKSITTCLERYQVDNPFKSPKLMKDAVNKKDYNSIVRKIKKTKEDRYGDPNYNNYELNKQRKIEKFGSWENYSRYQAQQAKLTSKRSIAIDGTSLDSSWEVKVYNYCLLHNIPITHGPSIKYNVNGKNHITHIDFEIMGQAYEVKGNQLLNDCYKDEEFSIAEKLKVYADNNVIVITDTSILDLNTYKNTFLDISFFN